MAFLADRLLPARISAVIDGGGRSTFALSLTE
jgi:hypothetical protein